MGISQKLNMNVNYWTNEKVGNILMHWETGQAINIPNEEKE